MKKLRTFLGFYVVCLLATGGFMFAVYALEELYPLLGFFLLFVPLTLLVWALYGLICRIEEMEKRIDELTGQPAKAETEDSCDKKISP
ncbi:hypothetical protein [Agathobaculum sp. TL06]